MAGLARLLHSALDCVSHLMVYLPFPHTSPAHLHTPVSYNSCSIYMARRKHASKAGLQPMMTDTFDQLPKSEMPRHSGVILGETQRSRRDYGRYPLDVNFCPVRCVACRRTGGRTYKMAISAGRSLSTSPHISILSTT